jgi:sterol desaturase/sphingolipid hydroxylase (fatty acid hydroxylase superfamily)
VGHALAPHSAEALSIITGARFFWLEDVINTAFFLVLGFIFKTPPEVATIASFLYLLPHGPLCLNNPQCHRIHHSVEPQHQNKNLCKMLPVFDVIFGTAWRPVKRRISDDRLGAAQEGNRYSGRDHGPFVTNWLFKG